MLNSSLPLLVALISLGISGIWLAYKLGRSSIWLTYKLSQLKIDDKRGLIIPSFIFLTIPFLAAKSTEIIGISSVGTTTTINPPLLSSSMLLPVVLDSKSNEFILSLLETKVTTPSLSPLLPALMTFILGRASVKFEEWQNTKKRERELLITLIFKIDQMVISPLCKIENLLMSWSDGKLDNMTNLYGMCEQYKLDINDLHKKLGLQLEVLESASGISTLYYIEKTKDELAKIGLMSLGQRIGFPLENKSDKNILRPYDEISYLRVLKIEGYSNIMNLLHEFSPNSKLFNRCISKLKEEKERLLILQKRRESRVRNKRIKDCKDDESKKDWRFYHEDPELAPEYLAIQLIDDTFRQFRAG